MNLKNPELAAALTDNDQHEERKCVDGAALLDDVCEFLGRFVAYPSEHAKVAHALWVFHAHSMAAWESTPRLAFLSPEPASGKTRALELTETLVPRACESVNMSVAYLFRRIAMEADPPDAPARRG